MARIMDTVKVCKACRSQALDAGVKIAMENHAGDMQAGEVVTLIEEAGGKDYMGANLDAGNAVWTLETPLDSLEVLGPYAVTTSLRDSAVWPSANGVTVQWTAMGAGMVDWVKYFDRFAELCPGVPVHIETISGFNREIPYYRAEFWEAFPEMKATTLAHYVAWAKDGEPRDSWRAPAGQDRGEAEKAYQRAEIEESIRYCKSIGLGMR
jgi:sugar phosphate isomerase/epimerase